ncbi:myomegalin-like isoform X2 [Solea senegalensis]|uniref:Myomegalin-like isoform X2 n=1 Tax=Solea senegalensis TaxID=28829 RepID=A0AAV6SCD5_SOLSE|nr:myomegalin-like isoform X2 [Solea senegalensis]
MLDVVKMKEVCRICARELCGNQRRWIFHPTAKLNLQVLLSHALGRELTRDGRGEFACSKCTFMLDRMYRFDTVIARVEALSLERLHKLLLEKDRLRQCIGGLYWKNNTVGGDVSLAGPGVGVAVTQVESEDSTVVDLSALQEARYSDMIQDDLAFSVFESWADKDEDSALDNQHHHLHHCTGGDSLSGQKPRRCRGCAILRVADSDYEAVCKVPRKVGQRSTSCGPATRYSTTQGVEEPTKASETTTLAFDSPSSGLDTDSTLFNQMSPSPVSSVESLDTAVDVSCSPAYTKVREESETDSAPARRDTHLESAPSESSLSGLEVMLSLLRNWKYQPLKPQRGSKLPVLVKAKLEQGISRHLSISLRSSCGGAADSELYSLLSIPEVVTPCPQQDLQTELAEMEDQWLDDYVQCGPFRFQQRLIYEQTGQLGHDESTAGQCMGNLQKAQQQVHSLQAKIRESDSRNQKLQERLSDVELELRLAQDEAQQQERNIQNISDITSSKEAEAADLHRVIGEQNKMLCSLKELTNLQQLQASGAESVQGQSELLALQVSLFQAQLELQAQDRAQRQAARTQEDLSQALQRLDNDLQGALQHRRETEKHNQELQLALEKARLVLQEKEEQLREAEQERRREEEEREKSIRELRTSLQTKEQLLEDYDELLEEQQREKRDFLLQKLHQRIRERDRALERAVDEKFLCVEEKEEEARRLQLLLREKERDLERQRCVLLNNEETITSLELLLRGKAAELEQMSDAWRNVQRQQQHSEERQSHALRERDTIIGQLQEALHTSTQEAQDLRCSLLAQIHSAPGNVLEELKGRLQLKDRLFQEVLADRTRQAQEHQDQVQSLLTALSSRDQYIQVCGKQLGEVMTEQTSRIQELRRQLSSGLGSSTDPGTDLAMELQVVQEELCVALRREKENQELSRSQADQLDSLSRKLQVKDVVIRDFQRQLVDPSDLPLVERLTQEVQELRESLVQQDGGLPAAGPDLLGRNRLNGRQPEFGEPSSEDEAYDDVDSVDKAERRVQSLTDTKSCTRPGTAAAQDVLFESQGLLEVKELVEQKRAVERELNELKLQLEKSGFSSLSQMRKALFSLQAEKEELRHQLTEGLQANRKHTDHQQLLERENDEEKEEELDVTIEGSEMWEAWDSELPVPHSNIQSSEEQRSRPQSLQQLTTSSQAAERDSRLQQKSTELKERLTVQAQTEQLNTTAGATVQRNSKLIQVDLQDPGYETCGRSENEAEREDTSSPEFDDLEMCTSLDCGSQWWPANSSSSSAFTKATTHGSGDGDEVSSLQRLVEDLRSQLSRSQGVIRGLQGRLASFSTCSDYGNSTTPRKVNWCVQNSPAQSGTEDDEGWQSSDGGLLASPHHPHSDKGLQELVSRVDALENQLRRGGKKSVDQDGISAKGPGKFDTLIQAQARELSHLRQRLREGRSVCNILTQHLGDTTKAFEELLRANDIDYYMGQSFREQLSQSSSLAQRVGAKISGRDHPEDPDEKTELLAIRLSKELQQKDKVIESLRATLHQHHHHHRPPSHGSDTPCSSHALSDVTDQSDRISYVSDDRGSTNGDVEVRSNADIINGLSRKEIPTSARVSSDCHSLHSSTTSHHHPSAPPSITSSHRTQSCLSCPSMHCPSSPHTTADMKSKTGFSTPQSKPLHGFPFTHQQSDPSAFVPLPFHGYQPSPFTSNLDASFAMKAGASLLESSALWDKTYGLRASRLGADLSSGSSGYQSGTSHTGSDLMKEHLREVRTLRQRLEDSIQTNDRLRQQLEDRLVHTAAEKGAPTNIYIQGLDSVGQLSSEIRLLKEENVRLQKQLKQTTAEGGKEVDQLKEAVLQEQSRLREAELEVERWAEQSRKLRAEAESHDQEITQLKQERQRSHETINRLQQQLSENHSLVHSLQCQLHTCRREGGVTSSTHLGQSGHSGVTFDLGGWPRAKRQLFNDNALSPPVRNAGLISPSSPLHPVHKQTEETGAEDHACVSSTSHHGCHAVGHIDDFNALQQQILEGSTLLCKMKAALSTSSVLQEFSLHQPSDSMKKLLLDTETLQQILEEAHSLLQMFWRAALPNAEETKEGESLTEEVASLRLRLSEQEQALKDAMESLRSSNRTKDSMEHFIVSQLSRTRDVLRKAKTNLQENRLRISSLGQASFTNPPPSPSSIFPSSSSSSSSRPWPVKGENTRGFCELAFSPGWSVLMKPQTSTSILSSSSAVVGPACH